MQNDSPLKKQPPGPPPELVKGQRLGEQFMRKIARDNYSVFESAFAAQVVLTHCKLRMGSANVQPWNEFVTDLLATLRFQ